MSTNTNTDQPIPERSSGSREFFAVCGGSTISTFRKTDPDDQQKRVNAGMVVVVIASVSAILASIAWSIPMGTGGIIVGPAWFLIMLLLERSILQQMDVAAAISLAKEWMNGNFSHEIKKGVGLGWLAVRFMMIFFICYFNSEMVRVIMFKPEIVAEIKILQNKETSAISASLSKSKKEVRDKIEQAEMALTENEKSLANLNADYEAKITALDDSLRFWNSKLVYEVKGPGGVSGYTGDGPVAKTIRETIARYEKDRAELVLQKDKAKTESVQAQSIAASEKELKHQRGKGKEDLAEIKAKEKELIDKVMERPVNGLSFMLSVLNDIAKRNILIWAVFAMFFFIEAIPVMLKYFSKNDSFIFERAKDYMRKIKDTNEKAREIYEALQNIKQQRASAV